MDFTKKSVIVVLVVIASIFVAFFTFEGNMLTGASIVDQDLSIQVDVTTCRDLDADDAATYNLQNDVSSAKECFTVRGHNLILDCHGFNITYGSSSAVNNSGGFNNITVKDCYATPAAPARSNISAFYFNGSENSTIINNTITTTNAVINAHGIVLESSNNNFVGYNNISYGTASGIVLNGTSNANTLVNNTLVTSVFAVNIQHINDSATGSNSLIYNNSLSSVHWNSTDLTINYSVPTYSGDCESAPCPNPSPRIIFIEQNLVGLRDVFYIGNLNRTAQIQIKGLGSSFNPHLFKAGVRCDNQADSSIKCNISYDVGAGILTANVTSFSNYTVNSTTPNVSFITPANGSNFSAETIGFNLSILGNITQIQTGLLMFNTNATVFNRTLTNNSGNWSATVNFSDFPEGLHSVIAYANNTVGNFNNTVNISFTVDRTAPNVSLTSPPAGATISSLQSFNATVDDNVTAVNTVIFQFSNGTTPFNRTAANTSGVWGVNVETIIIADGALTITVFANDTVGNMNNTQTLALTVNNAPGAGGGGKPSAPSEAAAVPAPSVPTPTEPSAPPEPSVSETASPAEVSSAFESGQTSVGVSPTGRIRETAYTSVQNYKISLTNNLDKKLVLTGALKEKQQEIRLENEENVKKRLKEELLLEGEVGEAALEKKLGILKLLESVEILQVYKTKLSHLLPPSLVGAAAIPLVPTGKHIEANLLKDLLLNAEELQNIEVNPGETLEKEIKIRRGLSFDPKPPQIIFFSGGEQVLVKDLGNHEEVVIGTAVDVDPETKKFDFYIIFPPQQQEGKETFTVEMNINVKKLKIAYGMPLKFTLPFIPDGESKTIFSELYGPYHVNLQRGALLAVQYDAYAVQGDYEVVGKVYKKGTELITENHFEIKQ